jgi:micrococcal nuclease
MFLIRRLLFVFIALSVAGNCSAQLFGYAPGHGPNVSAKPIPPSPEPTKPLTCSRVVDGDTIHLSDGRKVRLIGVDTPETVHPSKPVERFGKEASAYTKALVEGKEVVLDYDQEKTDKYGRTLAYVYLKDGTHVNAAIIQNGYGFAYTKYPFKYMEQFRNLERIAREQKKGLWADETQTANGISQPVPQINPINSSVSNTQSNEQLVFVTKSGTKYHKQNCSYLKSNGGSFDIKQAEMSGYGPCSKCF